MTSIVCTASAEANWLWDEQLTYDRCEPSVGESENHSQTLLRAGKSGHTSVPCQNVAPHTKYVLAIVASAIVLALEKASNLEQSPATHELYMIFYAQVLMGSTSSSDKGGVGPISTTTANIPSLQSCELESCQEALKPHIRDNVCRQCGFP